MTIPSHLTGFHSRVLLTGTIGKLIDLAFSTMSRARTSSSYPGDIMTTSVLQATTLDESEPQFSIWHSIPFFWSPLSTICAISVESECVDMRTCLAGSLTNVTGTAGVGERKSDGWPRLDAPWLSNFLAHSITDPKASLRFDSWFKFINPGWVADIIAPYFNSKLNIL